MRQPVPVRKSSSVKPAVNAKHKNNDNIMFLCEPRTKREKRFCLHEQS